MLRSFRTLTWMVIGWCLQEVAVAQTATVTLSANTVRLLEFPQTGADLAISVEAGDERFLVNHPLGHTGPELIVLGPYQTRTTVRFSAVAVDGKAPDELDLRSTVLSPQDPALPAYRSITEAGRLFAQKTAESVSAALQAYQTAAQMNVLPGAWRDYPAYLAARVEYFLFDLEAAKARLEALPADSCAIPDFCYKADLLLQQLKFNQDDIAVATVGLQRVVDVIRRSERKTLYSADLAYALIDLGISQAILDQRELALPNLEEALALAEAADSNLLRGEAYNGLASYHVQPAIRNLTLVADYLQQAVKYLEAVPDERAYIFTTANLAVTYGYLGEYRLAQQLALNALPRAEQSLDASLGVTIYNLLANVYKQLGDWTPAEHYYRRVVDFNASSGRDSRFYNTSNSLGMLLRQKGDVQAALAIHRQSYEFFSSTTDRSGLSSSIYELALDEMAQGNYAEARKHFQQIALLGEAGERLLSQVEVIIERARLALAENNSDEALQILQPKWDEIAAQENRLHEKILLADMMMQLGIARGNEDAAERYGDTMLAMSDDIAGQLEHIRLGAAWSARTNDGHKRFAGLLIDRFEASGDPRYLERALMVLERTRAQNLINQRIVAGDSADAEETAERRSLRRRLTEVSNRRAALLVGSDEYGQATLEYFQLLEKFQADYVQRESGREIAANSFEALQAKLGERALVVEFLCLEQASCRALVMSRNQLKVFNVGDYADVGGLARELDAALRSTGSDTTALRSQLGSSLFAAIMQDGISSAATDMFVVADFPLNNLPFASLLLAQKQTLVDRVTVSMIPSISIYQPGVERNAQYPLDVAVFADPVFSAEAVVRGASGSNDFSGWLQSLDRLRWSAVEARNLEKVFSGRNMKLYMREDATRENLLKQETRNARILHIASHAYYNESMEDLVGIAFSADGPAESVGDFVTLQELFDTRFGAELVVISGCDTGVGAYLPGEGNLSLARGFIAQGVSHVISTLWPVSDRASVEFMRVFYEQLQNDGDDVKTALRAAQQSLAANPEFSDPFYWAPYMLTSVN